MSFEIKTGLFILDDFVDHHAILGMPVDADAQAIRKRYLEIARKLHPDSLATESEAEQKLATQVLSKWVNPAYEMLFQEKNRKEYQILVRLKGKQAIQQKVSIATFSEAAKKLLKSANIDHEYQQQIKVLSAEQYEDLNALQAITGKLSELNLIYLVRKEGNVAPRPGASANNAPASTPSTSGSFGGAAAGHASPNNASPSNTFQNNASNNGPSTIVQDQPQRMSLADGYLRRAEEYVRKRDYAQAVLELRDGLRAAPKDSRCHSLMGIVYLHQKQYTMAKVSIKRALELNPNDPRAQEAKRHLERLGHHVEAAPVTGSASGSTARSTTQSSGGSAGNTTGGTASGGKTSHGTASKSDSGGAKKGGLFGGLFGKKK